MTIDGRIARGNREFTNWTSLEDKKALHRHLDRCDVIVVGHNTYTTALSRLKKRNCIVLTRSVRTSVVVHDRLVYFNPQRIKLDRYIREKRYRRVAILGGTSVYTFMLRKRLLSDLYLTIEPIVFGRGLPLVEDMELFRRARIISARRLNAKGSTVLHIQF